MTTLKSIVKSIPWAPQLVKYVRSWARRIGGTEPVGGFYTLSPDVLVALVKAFNIQKLQIASGRNLFDGYGYYEFGLYRGFSFWFAQQISSEHTGSSFRLFGFDSFEGLPKPELDREAAAFNKGDFRSSYEDVTANLKKRGADFSRIRLYKGFYSNDFFKKLRQSESFLPISICLIDVDLYNSCIPVLEFIEDLLVEGSILLFDDYNQSGEDDNSGERRALIEFERKHPGFKKEHIFDYGWEGAAFRVTSI
jgi:O-methyltransferase